MQNMKDLFALELEAVESEYPITWQDRLQHVQYALMHDLVDFSCYQGCVYNWIVRDVENNEKYDYTASDDASDMSSTIVRNLQLEEYPITTPIECHGHDNVQTLLEVLTEVLA